MSSDREVQARRRTALYEILTGDRRVTEQKELVDLLVGQGIPATQPSVSRDLKALGAIRTRGYYEIPSWEEEEEGVSPFRKALPFLLSVRPAGPHQTLLVTKPGAGRIVSQAINDSEWEEIVGTIDGDSAVLILTESFLFQRLVYERIKHFVSADEEFEIVNLE